MGEATFKTPLGEARLSLYSERKGSVRLSSFDVDGVHYASGQAAVSVIRGRWRVYGHWLKLPGRDGDYVHDCPAFTTAVRDALNAWWEIFGAVAERDQLAKQAQALKMQITEEERVLAKHRSELQAIEERMALLPAEAAEPVGTDALAALVSPTLA